MLQQRVYLLRALPLHRIVCGGLSTGRSDGVHGARDPTNLASPSSLYHGSLLEGGNGKLV